MLGRTPMRVAAVVDDARRCGCGFVYYYAGCFVDAVDENCAAVVVVIWDDYDVPPKKTTTEIAMMLMAFVL